MSVETVLLLLLGAIAVTVAVHWVAERTGLPAAALLTLIGIAYAYLPGPNVELDPHLVLTLVLPPLLYSAALDSSLLAIRTNMRTVVSLSVSLVFVTALLIGFGFSLFVAGATFAAGMALGAAVAPPDPVAALAVGRKVGLPSRLLTLIQGEGLLNDATALTILAVAVAAADGNGFSTPAAVGQFLVAALGGVAAGLFVAYAIRPLRRLRRDPLSSNAVSLATPFVAYLLAEAVHVSGVLAVVVAGLVIGHNAPYWQNGETRLQTRAVWKLVDYLLEGVVFLLIGLQLPQVIQNLDHYAVSTVVMAVSITIGVMLLLRPLWLVLTDSLPAWMHARLGGSDADDTPAPGGPPGAPRHREGRLSGREIVVLSWAGTRGVISLAAIFTLPLTTDAGAPFPDRDLLLFCAFVAVLVTLVGQGLTFAPLVHRLGVRADAADEARLRNEARAAAVRAGLARLDELDGEQHTDLEDAAIDDLRADLGTRLERYDRRLSLLQFSEGGEIPPSPEYEAALRVRRVVLDAEREELVHWRDAGQLPDESLRILQRELDHIEVQLPARRR